MGCLGASPHVGMSPDFSAGDKKKQAIPMHSSYPRSLAPDYVWIIRVFNS